MGERSLALLVLASVLLDIAVTTDQVLDLRSIYMLAPEQRGPLNGLVNLSDRINYRFAAAKSRRNSSAVRRGP